jgi:hypothetical protein
MEEGPFSENGNPKFFSSGGEEWAILGEVFTACLLFLTWRSSFSILHLLREGHKGVSHLSPRRSYPIGFSFSSFSILRENPFADFEKV